MSRGGRGRGRGRGGGGFGGFNNGPPGAFEMGTGETLFPTKPAPLFPDIELPIPPEISGEEQDLLLIYKQFLQGIMATPYFLQDASIKKDIERYSDKYRKRPVEFNVSSIVTDLGFFPDELHRMLDPKRFKVKKSLSEEEVKKSLLDSLLVDGEDDNDAKNDSDDNKEVHEEEEKEEEEDYDEDYDDDYNQNYFDNGEGYDEDGGADSDGPRDYD